MKTNLPRPKTLQDGYAMLWVMIFSGVSLMVLGGAMDWTSQSSRTTERLVDYTMAVAAAEGATETTVARIAHEFQVRGEGSVYNQLTTFKGMVPTGSNDPHFARYRFNDGGGNQNKIHAARMSPSQFVPLESQYAGLSGMAATYRVVSNAKDTLSRFGVTAGVGQDIQVATIPIFQFAIFYSQDMEILNGPPMVVNGRVHGNAEIYLDPNSSLTLESDITAVGNIHHNKHPLDPRGNDPNGSLIYQGQADGGVSSMNLPIGTNNSPEAVYEVLKVPPVTESPVSAMGKERYYNKSDLVIDVRAGAVVVRSGNLINNFGTVIPPTDWVLFLNTNVTFFNKREQMDVLCSEIDVAKLREWSSTNSVLRPLIGRDIDTVYIRDSRSETNVFTTTTSITNWTFTTNTTFTTNITHRTNVKKKNVPPDSSIVPGTKEKYQVVIRGKTRNRWRFDQIDSITSINNISSNYTYTTSTVTVTNAPGNTQSGVRLVNGEQLPTRGLTVSTPNPLYIKGHYNVTRTGATTTLASHDTSNTRPASVVADAVTILSTAWDDANSGLSRNSRIADHTTVNAAILTGNVPSGTQNRYSGGVENFPRFLEKWSGKTLTYNGSLVCMFESQVANAPWGGSDVYSPPGRNWAFDTNFTDATKLPPATPQIRSLIRSKWAVIPPNTQSF